MILFGALFLTDILALWLIISGRGRWFLKILALLLICTVNIGVVHAFRYGNGFPTSPPKVPILMIYCSVVEPGYGHPAVYLWGIPQTTENHKVGYDITGAPRAYELPYSKRLEAACVKAQKGSQQGIPTVVSKAKRGKKGKRGYGPHSSGLHFYREPPVLLNPKH